MHSLCKNFLLNVSSKVMNLTVTLYWSVTLNWNLLLINLMVFLWCGVCRAHKSNSRRSCIHSLVALWPGVVTRLDLDQSFDGGIVVVLWSCAVTSTIIWSAQNTTREQSMDTGPNVPGKSSSHIWSNIENGAHSRRHLSLCRIIPTAN